MSTLQMSTLHTKVWGKKKVPNQNSHKYSIFRTISIWSTILVIHNYNFNGFYVKSNNFTKKLSKMAFQIEIGWKMKYLWLFTFGTFFLPQTLHQNICLKLGRGIIFGPYAHFLLMKFFSKNLNFFFDFLKILWVFIYYGKKSSIF